MSVPNPDWRQVAVITTHTGDANPIDLREFFEGGSGVDRSGTWTGDFEGRPQLAAEFREYLEREPLGDDSLAKRLTGARNLFRFLDDAKDLPTVTFAADISEIHGIRIKRWLSARGVKSPHTYQDIKTVVQGCRDMLGLTPLIWPARDPDAAPAVAEPDYPGIQRLSLAVRQEAREIKAMFQEGNRLVDLGKDPRVGPRLKDAWTRRENQAWLIHRLTSVRLPLKDELSRLNATRVYQAVDTEGTSVLGPQYLAPCMTERAREGYVGKLRWFHPALYDTAAFIWLVMLHTGWNLATVFGIDISEDGSWFERHPHQPGFIVIHAWKDRADRHQFAICQERPEFHPYQVIKFMIARTARLRETLRIRLRRLEEENRREPSAELRRRIGDLHIAVKSPWLYHSLGKGGDIGWFKSGAGSTPLKHYIRAVAEKHSLVEEHPYLASLSPSQSRDAWINYAYASTGQTLVAQYAAGHRNRRTLRYYLAARRYRRYSEKKFRVFQEHVFSEIAARRLDPTRLRILVQNGQITPEMEARLLDLRNRTRMNMRCLDPLDPPKEVAPDHIASELCRVQRCTGCPHGIAFDDALEPLAHALADLHAERRIRPLDSWRGTSLEDEERSIAATLRQFDPEAVRAAYLARVDQLKSGEARVFDAYPLY